MSSLQSDSSMHYSTLAIHGGSKPDPTTGAVIPPLHVATTFKQDGVGKNRGFEYGRTANPTRSALEALLTSLETNDGRNSTEGGESLVFASGSAATAAICHWASLSAEEGGGGGRDGKTGGGGHVLAVNDVYGGTARYLARAAKPTGLEVTFLNMETAGEEGIRQAIRPDTRLIWIECPTNPLLLVPPLPLLASIIASLDPSTRPLVVCDTTFLSSFNFTPLIPASPGAPPLADIVLSSLTKYSGGHSDIILGSLTVPARTVQLCPQILTGLRFNQNSLGATASPRDCHLMIRSLKTLPVRALRHGLNALRIAHWLSTRDEVESVRYPGWKGDGAFHTVEGLLSATARRELEYLGWKFPFDPAQADGEGKQGLAKTRTLGIPFGGMVGFKLKGAGEEETERFLLGLKVVLLAESLGGVESLVEVPYGMTHQGLPAETRKQLGITPNLIRLSVGLEDVEDLQRDLERGFAAMRG